MKPTKEDALLALEEISAIIDCVCCAMSDDELDAFETSFDVIYKYIMNTKG